MTFTKEEIDLCQEIAKIYCKPIKKGDYIARETRGLKIPYEEYVEIVHRDGDDIIKIEEKSYRIYFHSEPFILDSEYLKKNELIPLWTWRDCRDWLKEKGWRILDMYEHEKRKNIITVALKNSKMKEVDKRIIVGKGKTDLEAILKCVLQVLKEGK